MNLFFSQSDFHMLVLYQLVVNLAMDEKLLDNRVLEHLISSFCPYINYLVWRPVINLLLLKFISVFMWLIDL